MSKTAMYITAIIPNYNHEQYLRERLDSVLQQTRKPDEIIVLDDCSTDASRSVIESYVLRYPEIVFVPNQTNSGSTFHQWNKGVQLAKGNWIWIAESDDVAAPELLEQLEKAILQHPSVVIAYCQSHEMNAEGQVVGNWQEFTNTMKGGSKFKQDFVLNGKAYTEQFLIHKNTIPNASAVLFNKAAFLQMGGANTQLKSNGDWLVWLQLSTLGDIAFVAQAYNFFRRHMQSVIGKIHATHDATFYREQYDYTMRKWYKKYINSSNVPKISRKIRRINATYISFDTGNKGLFLISKQQYLLGWYHILKASIMPKVQTGFLKKVFLSK